MGERGEVATWSGKGGGDAEVEGGGGRGGSGGVVRSEGFPRMPVRVLLVEGDDSTRQIIAALLRKCSYRVAVASDGLKAWEMLKERAHNIDLVLTEVELPVISGFVLLTMIMEHETCRHIPVIMMSSHDSISMVFKCMLKGAADFLVKPIRKNELRNLWQHVWRRHCTSGGHGGMHYHDENPAERNLQSNFGNNASHHSSEYVPCMQKYKDDSEKASDAQSSCTRSAMEAESAHMQNMQESMHPKFMDFSLTGTTIAQNGEKHIQSQSTLVMVEDDGEDKSTMLGSEATPCNEVCNSNELIQEEENAGAVYLTMNKGCMDYNYMTSEGNGQTPGQAKHEKEVFDLIGSINNQLPCGHKLRDTTSLHNDLPAPAEFAHHEKTTQLESSSIPLLELSLKRHLHTTCQEKDNNESSTLNHSNFSAFSLYNNRTLLPTSSTPVNSGTECKGYFATVKSVLDQDSGSRTLLPTSRTPMNSGTEFEGRFTTVKPLWDQDSENGCNAAHDATRHTNQQHAKLPDAPLSCQNGMEIQPPLGAFPFPVPIIWQSNGSVMQSIFYLPSDHSLWSTIPTMWQEAVHGNSSYQGDPGKVEAVQGNHPDAQSTKSTENHPSKKHDRNTEVVNEQKHISSARDESGSSNICNGSTSHLNSRGCGSFCFDSNGKTAAPDVSEAPTESGNDEGMLASVKFTQTEFHRLNQREAALTKFRLKRKDRCYEKKVRYQSRKRLAEKRPRVKGQFVRQLQPTDSTDG